MVRKTQRKKHITHALLQIFFVREEGKCPQDVNLLSVAFKIREFK